MTYRRVAQVWYGSRRWKAKRLAQLRAQPLCVFCERDGKVTPATIADHVIPHKGDESLFWYGRLQSLCTHHHSSTAQKMEKGGLSNNGYGEDGWPIDFDKDMADIAQAKKRAKE